MSVSVVRFSANWSTRVKRAVGVAGLLLGICLLSFLALWFVPSWLTQDPPLDVPSERYKAAADARTGVVAFLAVLGGIGGLYYTSRTLQLTRKAQIAARDHANE